MLFYNRGKVLVRIKTRGSGGNQRGGIPHLVVGLMSGALNDDGKTRVIILTGNDRAFAAGADISEMQNSTPVKKIM